MNMTSTWRWQTRFGATRADLEQDGEIVTGSVPGIGRGARKIDIKNGSIKNGEIYFEIEYGSEDNKTVVVHQGKQTGDSIEGTRKTINADGEENESDWFARRAD